MTMAPFEWADLLGRLPAPEECLVLQHVRACCLLEPLVGRALLFGSRARGTHTTRSDFDFAFEWRESDAGAWAVFCDHVYDASPTVHGLDLLNLDSVNGDLRARILAEGKEFHHA